MYEFSFRYNVRSEQEETMQRTLAVANYFIEKSNYTVTPLQLIKLIYISYGYVLAIVEERLFLEDNIEAWEFGPVIPSIYHSFKHYKKQPITELSSEITFDDDLNFEEKTLELNKNEENYEITIKILDKVWERYKKYTGYELIDLTHKDGTPWSEVYNEETHHIPISDDLIKEYYSNLIK